MSLASYASPYDTNLYDTIVPETVMESAQKDTKSIDNIINMLHKECEDDDCTSIKPSVSTSESADYQTVTPIINETKTKQTPEISRLLNRMEYLVHLMEENGSSRTDYVTEELILYCFLGIFIIFLVDTFLNAGITYKR